MCVGGYMEIGLEGDSMLPVKKSPDSMVLTNPENEESQERLRRNQYVLAMRFLELEKESLA
jgi:hypothetical protein